MTMETTNNRTGGKVERQWKQRTTEQEVRQKDNGNKELKAEQEVR